MCHTPYSLAICFAPSLSDSFIFLTLTRLVVVFIFVNFSFALFTPPLGDYHDRWQPWSRWRTGQSGAPSRPLARPRVSRRSRSRPLARPTVGSPDSPVNYSRTPPIEFPRAASLQEPAWHTGHCPVHHRTVRCTQTELTLAEQSHLISNSIFPVSST